MLPAGKEPALGSGKGNLYLRGLKADHCVAAGVEEKGVLVFEVHEVPYASGIFLERSNLFVFDKVLTVEADHVVNLRAVGAELDVEDDGQS